MSVLDSIKEKAKADVKHCIETLQSKTLKDAIDHPIIYPFI